MKTSSPSKATLKDKSSSISPVTVFVVDSDATSARIVVELAASRSLATKHFECAEHLWEELEPEFAGCIVTEVDLPGMSGLQLQEKLKAAEIAAPLIMLSEQPEVSIAVRAMKAGAIDFLTKPFRLLNLWESIQFAIEKNRIQRHQNSVIAEVRSRLNLLTDDEYQVMRLVLDGQPNKAVAKSLEVSLRTVDFRRSSIMRKMRARSIVEVAQMLTMSGLDPVPLRDSFAQHLERGHSLRAGHGVS